MNLSSMTREQLEALCAKQAQEIGASKTNGLTLQVGKSGTVHIRGINGKFGVALYREQAEKVIELVKSGRLEAFIREHARELPLKDGTFRD